MLFLPTDAAVPIEYVEYARVLDESEASRRARSPVSNSQTQFTLDSVRIGQTAYRLRRPLYGSFVPTPDGIVEFIVSGMARSFVGCGSSFDEAFRNWEDSVHVAFQDLIGKRQFEMTEEDRAKWKVLEEAIDVTHYLQTTPIEERRLGWLSRARPIPSQVTWSDGSREAVTLDEVPATFARFKPGQWFEAITVRDRFTNRLLSIKHVRPTRTIRRLAASEREAFMDTLPTTAGLPNSKRDWSAD